MNKEILSLSLLFDYLCCDKGEGGRAEMEKEAAKSQPSNDTIDPSRYGDFYQNNQSLQHVDVKTPTPKKKKHHFKPAEKQSYPFLEITISTHHHTNPPKINPRTRNKSMLLRLLLLLPTHPSILGNNPSN
jgi:hypothetical protein